MTRNISKQSTKSGGLATGAAGPSGFDDRIATRAISTMIGPPALVVGIVSLSTRFLTLAVRMTTSIFGPTTPIFEMVSLVMGSPTLVVGVVAPMIGPWHQSYKQWLRLSLEQQLQPLNHQHRSPDQVTWSSSSSSHPIVGLGYPTHQTSDLATRIEKPPCIFWKIFY